MKTLPP